MRALSIFGIAFGVSLLVCLLLVFLGPRLGFVDHPGGRKDHVGAVPVGGGLALYIALVSVGAYAGLLPQDTALIFAAAIIVIAGFADDLLDVSHRIKFLAQGAAVLVMIYGAGVMLHSVGNLIGSGAISFGWFAVPATLFAALGVINAVNMADGMDGVCGTIALIASVTLSAIAHFSGHADAAATLLLMAGATAGFLTLNLRVPGRSQGLLFLGDAGSMLLGFFLVWFTLELTQGPRPAMAPIAALWIVVLPLCDCVSLLLRRIQSGRSPFKADRQHLHHYLLQKGLSVPQSHAVITAASLLFAGIGWAGWYFHIPEPVLFDAFVILFLTYHFAMKRAFQQLSP
jgi:UDP-GlcNAc:undecaprenyl-phosphate GlcNAc-1-phosphate transferase